MNKDVLFTIYEIVHRDLTKQLNTEYIWRLNICETIGICFISIKYNRPGTLPKAYNYRSPYYNYRLDIHTKYGKKRCGLSKNH